MTSFCGSCHWSQDWQELWVLYRHGKKHCLWTEIRGKKCSLWRWWFGLFLGPRSIVMILLIKSCWTQFSRGMSFWTGAVCRHWLITTGLTWRKKHSTQNSPNITREDVFPGVHHLPPAQPTTSRTKWKVPTTPAHRVPTTPAHRVPKAFVRKLDSVSERTRQWNPGDCLSFDVVVRKYATNFSSWY